jgi:hypothetical protein
MMKPNVNLINSPKKIAGPALKMNTPKTEGKKIVANKIVTSSVQKAIKPSKSIIK